MSISRMSLPSRLLRFCLVSSLLLELFRFFDTVTFVSTVKIAVRHFSGQDRTHQGCCTSCARRQDADVWSSLSHAVQNLRNLSVANPILDKMQSPFHAFLARRAIAQEAFWIPVLNGRGNNLLDVLPISDKLKILGRSILQVVRSGPTVRVKWSGINRLFRIMFNQTVGPPESSYLLNNDLRLLEITSEVALKRSHIWALKPGMNSTLTDLLALQTESKMALAAVSKITGKDKYEFGDLSKVVLGNLTAGISAVFTNAQYLSNLNGSSSLEQLLANATGSFSKLSQLPQKAVSLYTGKDEYKFGDITKATLRYLTGS